MKINIEKLNQITDKIVISHSLIPVQPLLIGHEIDGVVIPQRPRDGYINATLLCKQAGKEFKHYNSNKVTKDFLTALSTEVGIPTSVLVQTLKGGNNPKLQGSWVHPQVAINLAQWLSPQFAVQVSKWVFEWMTGQVSGFMPDHVKRYMKNRAKIPHTHFSMLNEIYLNLIAPLENHGFRMPDKMIPDISTGKIFSDFLRNKGIDPDKFPRYEHEFTDNRPIVYARLYPIEYLADFRKFFNEEWLPQKSVDYFKKRAPNALPYIKAITLIESQS